ncbi:agglutinin-like protein 1 [Dendronephthya gigantea]|uniref:agglutinin-like protein 1 n=1 Tax=Dendronephthya gigantea TaxID=151771 RepID=UPI00106D1F25|nr:agglutinin-like protein 1 [Dendronephthya gigantea]
MDPGKLVPFLFLTSAILFSKACEIRYYKVGCYYDWENPRTFPNLLLNARYSAAKKNPGYTIAWDVQKYQTFLPRFICDCAKAVVANGNKYFGIQYYAECWSGTAGPETFAQLDPSKSCVNSSFGICSEDSEHCTGADYMNLIYYVPDRSKTDTKKPIAVTTRPPKTTTKPPTTTTKPPTTTTEPPTTTTKPPTITTKPPTTTTKPPTTTTKPSTTTTKPPTTTTKASTTTTKPPTTTTEPPTTTTKPPTTTTKPPTTTTKASTTTTKPPTTTTEPPTTTTKPPTTTTKASKPTTPVAVTRTEDPKKPDCMKTAEILIALDVSSSISLPEFEKRKKLLVDFVGRFPVNTNEVHFGLLHYNHIVHTDFTFEDPFFYNIDAVQRAIFQVPLLGGATLTQKALHQAFRVFSESQYGERAASTKILIIVTDGYTYGGVETLELPSLRLQLSGVKVVAIGLGTRVNVPGLRVMTRDVITMGNILHKTEEELSKYLEMLIQVVCH